MKENTSSNELENRDVWMELHSGTDFYFTTNMQTLISKIKVEDVAHALSLICRYNGHSKRFYSVGEHTIVLAKYIERNGGTARECLTALCHDNSEYLIGDKVTPLKRLMPEFCVYEETLHEASARKFGTIWPHPNWIKEIDTRVLKDERAQIMRPSGNTWGIDKLEALGVKLMPIRGRFPFLIKMKWLSLHKKYTKKILKEEGFLYPA
jgi:hypothetical protein